MAPVRWNPVGRGSSDIWKKFFCQNLLLINLKELKPLATSPPTGKIGSVPYIQNLMFQMQLLRCIFSKFSGFRFIRAEYLFFMQVFEKFKQDLGSLSDYSDKYIGFLQFYQNTNYFWKDSNVTMGQSLILKELW